MSTLPILVLTPVKNEDWILECFLSVTSSFADHILLCDQQSTDRTLEIAARFPKVTVIHNPSETYDEGFRQRLLIEKARSMVSGPKLLLALDADEIMTADSLGSPDWRTFSTLAPGTVLCFEKPDIIFPVTRCIRHQDYFQLGYIDDGAPHTGQLIHSPRIPVQAATPRAYVEGIKFMHYALTRKQEYRARQRYYSVIENLKKVQPLYGRLLKYSALLNDFVSKHTVSDTPSTWFAGWLDQGIDMTTILSTPKNMFNLFVLNALREHGTARFALDDIWDFDWVIFEQQVMTDAKITPRSGTQRWMQKILLRTLFLLKRLRS